jgi:hypothetical protein
MHCSSQELNGMAVKVKRYFYKWGFLDPSAICGTDEDCITKHGSKTSSQY